MIVFDLHCAHGHRFEGWFGSSSDYEDQRARGLVSCPQCGASEVSKAPMAPAVPAKGNAKSDAKPTAMPATAPAAANAPAPTEQQPLANMSMTPEMEKALGALAKAQEKALKDSTWVGKDFAKQSREMHYGEREQGAIHGQASLEEAKELVDEGVSVAPLPFPVAPPDELN